MVGLADKADRLPRDLTQIEMRKLELARAMAAEPRLLIADEAMAGLSHQEVDDILALLIRLNGQGVTIIMIEHIMRAVMAVLAAPGGAGRRPQDRRRRPAGRRAAARRRGGLPWRASLTITGLDAGYGAVRVLHDVVADGARRRDGGAARHQRQRQVDADEVHHGHGAPVRRHASTAEIDGTRHELVGMSTEAIVDLGIAFVPEGRRLFPTPDGDREPAAGRLPPIGARRRSQRNLAFCFEAFPRLAERRQPARRLA